MKRVGFMLMVVAAMIFAFSMATLNAADAPEDGTELSYLEKVVVFNHSSHGALECNQCHHTWDGSSEIQGCTAEGCHDIMDRSDKSERSFYRVIHGKSTDAMETCISCHKDTAPDRDTKKWLTTCKESACHPE